jgi:hypothetical protein
MNPFQFAIATSTGASARADKIDPAMMMPAVDSWLMTRTAPTARTSDCRIERKDF